MATPFIAPEIIKNSKDFETPSSSPKGLYSSVCDDCSSWCVVCEKFKNYEYKGKPPTSAVNKPYCDEPMRTLYSNYLNSPNVHYDYKKINQEKPKQPISKFQANTQDNYREENTDECEFNFQKNGPIKTIEGKGWCVPNTSVVSEKYFKEVEALRQSLRELSAYSRKLPMLPTEGSAKSTKSANGIRNKMSMSLLCNDGAQKLAISDSKRIRHLSDSDSCAVVNISAAPKRLRDQSPLILVKENHDNFSALSYENGDAKYDCSTSAPNLSNGVDYGATQEDALASSALTSLNSNFAAEESHDSGVYSDGTWSRRGLQDVASSSPSYIVGDTLEKITLEDFKPNHSPDQIQASNKEKTEIHPSLRPSLFPHVPPYIKFYSNDHKVEKPLPKTIRKILKWKLSTITPIIVRQTVVNSGYKLVRRSTDWGGTWGRHMKSIAFKTLNQNQKNNHIPGTFQIGRKDRLWKNLYRYMTKYGKKEFGFIPRTYVLPQDNKLLKGAFERAGNKSKWIVKPPASARGTGIKVIHKWTQVPKKAPLIVQKYISNPYLINGNKFDLRLYVLVTSFNPLRIYLYDNGLVRFASVKYSEENSTLSNRCMHLTNYSINKLSNNYAQNEDAEACEGHKWTIRSLWTYLEETESIDIQELWKNLIELIIKTMISGESVISQMTKANLNSRYSAYELFGFDVLLDENIKPWLLEVNISPSLHSSSPLDVAVKSPLVTDLLNIAGFHIPNMMNLDQANQIGEKLGIDSDLLFDYRMYILGLSTKEKIKHATFSKLEERELYLDTIIEDLTPDDVRHLIVYEDEMTQIGNFQKIFPTEQTHKYFQYLEGNRYYNMLFDAWEEKFHNNREEGIKILEEKCRLQMHLDISSVEPRHAMICVPNSPPAKYDDSDTTSDSPDTISGNRNNNAGSVEKD